VVHDPWVPVTRSRLDYLLIPFLLLAVLNGWMMSLPEGLGVAVSDDSPWPPLRSLHAWAVEYEPAHLDIPPALRASLLYDAFVQAPAALLIAWRLWRAPAPPWLRPFGIAFGATAVTNMWFYFFQTFAGDAEPRHLGVYLPMNLPWLVVPALLIVRLWPRPAHAHARG
jgi:hypothetical protein